MQLPPQFKARYAPIAPAGFFEALTERLPKTLRVNTLKTDVTEFKRRVTARGWELVPVAWCNQAFRVDREDRSIPLGHSLEHFTGWCYIQEASSMIPPLVLDPQPGERVLDMAAAPGSKTTQLAAMMENRGLLVANDSSAQRIKGLTSNLERIGTLNTVVTNLSGPRLGRYTADYFDRVLLDAPCTAEGTMVKNPELLKRWSANAIPKLASLQSRLLVGAYAAVKPGGVVVYSTCTFAPEENEGVLHDFLANHPEAVIEKFALPNLELAGGVTEWQGRTFNPQVANARRVWPGGSHGDSMEGFFIAKIRKPKSSGGGQASTTTYRHFSDRRLEERGREMGEWLTEWFGFDAGWDAELAWRGKDEEYWLTTPEAAAFDLVPVIRRGLRVGRGVRGGFKPTSSCLQLMGRAVKQNLITTAGEQTMHYLRGKDLPIPAKGYAAMAEGDLVYACGLGLGEKIKNQLPTSRRLPDPR